MDGYRLGATLRAVRRRLGRRQQDVARVAGISDVTVSRIERGAIAHVRVDTILRVGAAIGVRVEWSARWRGAELDRMLNAAHAGMHEAVAGWLESSGWIVLPEVSFSIYGERGIIDVLAMHPGRRMLLVLELKSAIVDVQALIGSVDRYARLAPRIARDRGWATVETSAWALVADGRTNRRIVGKHARVLRAAFPADGRSMHAWLRNPSRPIRALSFLPLRRWETVRRGTGGPTRVRVPGGSVAPRPGPAESSPPVGSAERQRPHPTLPSPGDEPA